MSVSLKNIAFLIGFWMVGVLGAWGVANTTDSQPLEMQGMNDVRGSAPGPNCTGNFTYFPCTEKGDTKCWAADHNLPGCDQTKLCEGCNKPWLNETCSSARPWNAICDPNNNYVDSKGCGVYFNSGAKCSWNNNTMLCRCSGFAGGTDCAEYGTSTTVWDPCTIVR
jgi:hypothetical protein